MYLQFAYMYASWLHMENQKSRLTFAKQTDRYRDMHTFSTRFSLTKYFMVCLLLEMAKSCGAKPENGKDREREQRTESRELSREK